MGAFAEKVAKLKKEVTPFWAAKLKEFKAKSDPEKVETKKADEAPWEHKLQEQVGRLRQHVPTSADEATAKALHIIKSLSEGSYNIGQALRARQHAEGIEELLHDPTPGMPGREVMIDLPATKLGWFEPRLRSKEASILSPITVPLHHAMQDLQVGATNELEEQKDKLTRVTSNPGTLPWFYPAAALTVPNQFVSGFRNADKQLSKSLNNQMDEKVEQARREFETALHDEYVSSRPEKTAGAIIDGLAQAHVKSADGELNQALGIYLSLAGLLGQGSYLAAKEWAEKRDPKQQYLSSMREAIKSRLRNNPPSVLVANDPIKAHELAPDMSAVQYEPPEPPELDRGQPVMGENTLT